jgi:hypothetical protein
VVGENESARAGLLGRCLRVSAEERQERIGHHLHVFGGRLPREL